MTDSTPATAAPLDREGERNVELMRDHAVTAAAAGHMTWAEADHVICATYDRERMRQEAILRGTY